MACQMAVQALSLVLLGIAQLWLASRSGWAAVLWAWSGLSFVAVGSGYAHFGAAIFGKRPDGTIPLARVIMLWPYFLFTWSLWHLQRLVSRENSFDEVAPGLWVGRRPLPGELPSAVSLVVDLTAEFALARGVTERCEYLCIPTLDGGVPNADRLAEAMERIGSCPGGVFIHCASGHGRSAMVAVLMLLQQGRAMNVEDAVQIIRAARPAIGFRPIQDRTLREFERALNMQDRPASHPLHPTVPSSAGWIGEDHVRDGPGELGR
jgi:protein-tyrosine phosphatase